MTIAWGILATGRIAQTFADALTLSAKNALVAVGSRHAASAAEFASRNGNVTAHASYDALINDTNVRAIYIATPHSDHAQWTLKAIARGKAVLCEKPMGLNHAQTMAMVDAAQRQGTFLMEAFMYRLHPQTQRVLALIKDGAIGEVRHIEASFGYHADFDPDSRLFANALAGGGIMDVGCYPLSFARLIAGGEPTSVNALGHLGQTGVDEWSTALLGFHNNISAQLSTGVSLTLANTATIYGANGHIHLPRPWLPVDGDGNWSFSVQRGTSTPSQEAGHSDPLYVIEADHVADCLAEGLVESPVLSWSDSLGNALASDAWRLAIGLEFAAEQPENHAGPLIGKLAQPDTNAMRYGDILHLDKPVSRLVMGCDNQPSMSHAAVMWDNFFELGGNAFDTAYIYGDGLMEKLLGHWHTQRGVRNDIVIIGKGAHTPDNFPHAIAPQLTDSLERLQTDCVDVYFLHRDNTSIPAGEFVDALNDEVARGRIRAFGGSNWTLTRIIEANAYARDNGKQGFSAISNNFSLARMVNPIWPGVEAASTPQFVEWLIESQVALMPWSSQARGFFTPWADKVIAQSASENLTITTMQPTMDELRHTWFADDNFERRKRAQQVAAEYSVSAIEVALAFVLRQKFPTFPLIGPRVLAETRSSLSALNVKLTDSDLRYLNLLAGDDNS